MKTGMQCRVKKLGERDYMGFIIAVDEGRYLWSQQSGIRRLSRGDAMKDANSLAHQTNIRKFNEDAYSEMFGDDPSDFGIDDIGNK